MIYKPILFQVDAPFSSSYTAPEKEYQLLLSDHSQEHVDQLDSTKPMLSTPVNTVMSLWGVKEWLMRADRLEN